uniref:TIR domain-containing protein n=1 Tax=Bracon brevicornis TaxID=1563983 RepID=A0A6V7IYV6_9HYME
MTHIGLTKRFDGKPRFHVYLMCTEEDWTIASCIGVELVTRGFGFYIQEKENLKNLDCYMEIQRGLCCSTIIVLLSPAFLDDEESMFLLSHYTTLGKIYGRPRVIPIIYKNCVVSPRLRKSAIQNFDITENDSWERLVTRLKSRKVSRAMNVWRRLEKAGNYLLSLEWLPDVGVRETEDPLEVYAFLAKFPSSSSELSQHGERATPSKGEKT